MTFEKIRKRLEDAVECDFEACEKRADEVYVPFCVGALMRNAASCSSPDIVISPTNIAQEISTHPLRLNKKDADPNIIAMLVALYTALNLVEKECHVTETKEGFVIQMYQKPDTAYLSTSDIKARISKMRAEYVQ